MDTDEKRKRDGNNKEKLTQILMFLIFDQNIIHMFWPRIKDDPIFPNIDSADLASTSLN